MLGRGRSAGLSERKLKLVTVQLWHRLGQQLSWKLPGVPGGGRELQGLDDRQTLAQALVTLPKAKPGRSLELVLK